MNNKVMRPGVKIQPWAQGYVQGRHTADRWRGIVGVKGNRLSPGIASIQGLKVGPNLRGLGLSAEALPLVKPLAKYIKQADGGLTGSQTIQALVYNPSDRLRLFIGVEFAAEDLSAPDPTFNNTPTWIVTAMMFNPETGRQTPLQQAYPDPSVGSANLPDGYEADTSDKLLRVTLTLQDDNLSSSYVPTTKRCLVNLVCFWEPNIDIDAKTLERLYTQCSVSAPAAPIEIQNNAV